MLKPLLSFSHTTNFSFVVFLSGRSEVLLSYRPFYFAVRKLQEIIIAFALVRRKMRCIKQKKGERKRVGIKITYDNRRTTFREKKNLQLTNAEMKVNIIDSVYLMYCVIRKYCVINSSYRILFLSALFYDAHCPPCKRVQNGSS